MCCVDQLNSPYSTVNARYCLTRNPSFQIKFQHLQLEKVKDNSNAQEIVRKWWAFPDSNWGPADYESDALTN